MAKKLLSVILALCMLIGCLPMAANAEEAAVTSGNCGPEGSESSVTWNYDTTTKTLTISGTGEMQSFADPGTYYGEGNAPWSNFYREMEKIIIGDGITSIGDYAFNCSYTCTSFQFPSTLKTVGNYAFERQRDKTDWIIGEGYETATRVPIVFPNGVTSIGEYAFYLSDIESVTLPSTVETIGKYAFSKAYNLSVTIPKNVYEIGEEAFYVVGDSFNGCAKVTSLRTARLKSLL